MSTEIVSLEHFLIKLLLLLLLRLLLWDNSALSEIITLDYYLL